MIQYTKVSYEAAKALDSIAKDIIVYEPASGDVFRFSSPQWKYRGTKYSVEELIQKIGSGIESHYDFIFVNVTH